MGDDPTDLRVRFERDAIPLIGNVRRVARTFTRTENDADDLVQETYLRALERFHQFKPGTNLVGWLCRIAYTQFINEYRKRELRKTESLNMDRDGIDEPEYVPNPVASGEFAQALLSPAVREGMDEEMARALGLLSPELHDVLVLCIVGELKYRDAAVALGIPIGTVMSRLSRAKAALRQELVRVASRRPGTQKDGAATGIGVGT